MSEDIHTGRTERQLRWQDTTDGIRAKHRRNTRIVQDRLYGYAAKFFPAKDEPQAMVEVTDVEYWEQALAVAEEQLAAARRAEGPGA